MIEVVTPSPQSTDSCCRHITLVTRIITGSYVTTTRKPQFSEENPRSRVESSKFRPMSTWVSIYNQICFTYRYVHVFKAQLYMCIANTFLSSTFLANMLYRYIWAYFFPRPCRVNYSYYPQKVYGIIGTHIPRPCGIANPQTLSYVYFYRRLHQFGSFFLLWIFAIDMINILVITW